MDIIELERWKPSEAEPRKLEYAGQPTAQEVFEELKYRLESMGYLPDEYFLLDIEWENGREIPRDADIFCTTDYGGSEGVYLDVYLKWYDENQKKSITKSFITGKTLGENGNDLDRMFLISSAITKAFHGDHATHARYMKIGGVEDDTGGAVVHLSQQEQKVIIEALVEQRERQEQAMSQTEQLLRRMTGSITEYVNTVGMRPLRLNDYDKTILAIQDGNLSAFKELYPQTLKNHADDLLIEAAGRPGAVGRQMTVLLLSDVEQFPETTYRAACQKAIDINDPEKVLFLLEQAVNHVAGLDPSFYGELACCAYGRNNNVARHIVEHLSKEQITAAPSILIWKAVMQDDGYSSHRLACNGISADGCFSDIVRYCAVHHSEWQIENMLRNGLSVSSCNFQALQACIEYDIADAAKFLLDKGMDFQKFRDWAVKQPHGLVANNTSDTLEQYWSTLQGQTEEHRQGMGGQTFG